MALSVADQLEILDLYARYSHEADLGSGDVWAQLFVPEGEFERANEREGIGEATGTVKGRGDLAAINKQFVAEHPNYRHWIANITLDGEGSRAKGSCYAMVVEVLDDGVRFVTHGRYDDDLVKSDGGWRFLRRVVTLNS